jgi:hypothetical protein
MRFRLVDEPCECYDEAYLHGRSEVDRTGMCNRCGGSGLLRTPEGTVERCSYCHGGVCGECGGTGFRRREARA